MSVPARRDPRGFVAQRLYPDPGVVGQDGKTRHWLLTSFDEEQGGVFVKALTDEDVADWPELS